MIVEKAERKRFSYLRRLPFLFRRGRIRRLISRPQLSATAVDLNSFANVQLTKIII